MYTYSAQDSPRNANVRASDADREATGEELRRHHAEGRLEADEFQERIDRCYRARTVGELRELLSDLPHQVSKRESTGVRRLGPWLMPAMVLPALLTILAIGAIAHHGLWLLIPLFFLARLTFRHPVHRSGRWGGRRYGGGAL